VGVDQGIVDVPVAQKLHHMQDVLCFVVFVSGFPMTQCMECDFQEG
jgi:hypothetical protein